MNSQIFLHPTELILLLDKLRTCKLCFFLLESALMTMATPSSPMLFPLRLSSFIVLLRLRQSSRALIPQRPISFFFMLNTSKYFLSFKAAPRAMAPSAKMPLLERPSSVMYFLFWSTLLTALAPPGPMKFYESSNSLSVDCCWIALLIEMQPSHMILLLFKSRTSKLRLFSRLGASAFAPSSRIMQSLRCKLVKVSLSLMPLASASAPCTPMILPSSSNFVRNFLFVRHFES